MCGIAGIIDPLTPPSDALLDAMSAPLENRGPDYGDTFRKGDVGLAHRRLSIIDLGGGGQPMGNEDNTLIITFNGEIYDYDILRDELKDKGHKFRTNSDTEVLIHLYEEHGAAMLQRINGMFAFALYDLKDNTLFVARDRFGQKPFFYAHASRRFGFASGPASLRPLSWVDQSIDTSAIHDYLELQYIPTPRSIYTGIRKLPPGCYGIFREDRFTITQYWRPEVRAASQQGSYSDAVDSVRQTLDLAVTRRLVADVRVGLFLSGGMDSSIIAAIAQQHLRTPAHTFSIGFPERKYDERDYAAKVAAHVGTKHHFLEVSPDDFGYLTNVVAAYEEPFCDASLLPTALLSRFTEQHVKVALSGDGADELFGGYYRYRVMHVLRYLSICPKSLRHGVSRCLLSILPPKVEERTFWGRIRRLVEISDVDGLERYMKVISRCPGGLKESLYGDRMKATPPHTGSIEFLRGLIPGGEISTADTIMELDLKSYLNDDILVKVDRASMAYGLEVRSPFLDVNVAEMAMGLPYHWKQRGRRRKRILADAFRDLLPREIFDRPKMGFGVPIARWLRKEWRDQVRALLLDGEIVGQGYFLRERIEDLIAAHVDMRADYSYLLFALVVLEVWMREQLR